MSLWNEFSQTTPVGLKPIALPEMCNCTRRCMHGELHTCAGKAFYRARACSSIIYSDLGR